MKKRVKLLCSKGSWPTMRMRAARVMMDLHKEALANKSLCVSM
jgi:hypothetical protein